jgi:hypothetical protein
MKLFRAGTGAVAGTFALSVVLTMLLPATSASALPTSTPNVVVDGNFASPAQTAGGYTVFNAPSTFGGAWTVTSGSIDIDSATFFNPPGAPGTQTVDLDGTSPGAIAQTLTGLLPGGLYSGTFQLSANTLCTAGTSPVVKTLSVQAGAGTPQTYAYDTTTQSGWVGQTFSFTAPASGSATLTFQSTDSMGGCGPLVTDIAANLITPPQCIPNPTDPSHVITGSVPGSLNLSGGSWEVTGATVGGSILIAPGTNVVILGSTIGGGVVLGNGASVGVCGSTVKGALTASSTPAGVGVCSSTLNGGINVTGSTKFVLIGDPAEACGANSLTSAGGVTVAGNTGGANVIGNTISGSLNFNKNSGAGPLPADTLPMVGLNTIGGSLNCTANTPSVGGGSNTVSGTKTGQCKTL